MMYRLHKKNYRIVIFPSNLPLSTSFPLSFSSFYMRSPWYAYSNSTTSCLILILYLPVFSFFLTTRYLSNSALNRQSSGSVFARAARDASHTDYSLPAPPSPCYSTGGHIPGVSLPSQSGVPAPEYFQVQRMPAKLPVTKTENYALLRLAKLFLEEPDAAYLRYENWARPGLWGFRAGNRPVLPGGAGNSGGAWDTVRKQPPLLTVVLYVHGARFARG
jgi:hypothetical protein